MLQYLQPKPPDEVASKVRCPVCNEVARLSQVGSSNGNKGRWFYVVSSFDLLMECVAVSCTICGCHGCASQPGIPRKDQPPLRPASGTEASGAPQQRRHVPPEQANRALAPAGQPAAGYGSAARPSATPQTLAGVPASQHTGLVSSQPPVLPPQHAGAQHNEDVRKQLDASQRLSQDSQHATQSPVLLHGVLGSPVRQSNPSQNATQSITLQHGVPGSPVRQSNCSQRVAPAIMPSPPKSPPGSLAARAAALSQALQNSQQNFCSQDVQPGEPGGLTGDVRERSLSDDVDALFDVLGSPAVLQKIAKVSQKEQAGGTQALEQEQPRAAAEERVSGSSSDDDAILDVLNSPAVKRKLQLCQPAGGATATRDAKVRNPQDMAPWGLEQAGSITVGENGIGAANASCSRAHSGRTTADRQHKNARLSDILTQRNACGGGEGAGEQAGPGVQKQFLRGSLSAGSAAPVQNQTDMHARAEAAASDCRGQAAGTDAPTRVEENEDDDIIMVDEQPAQPQQQAAERAPSQVIDLC